MSKVGQFGSKIKLEYTFCQKTIENQRDNGYVWSMTVHLACITILH
jgi:hypothetical protein